MKIFKEFVASVVFLILIPALGSTTLWAQTGAALSVPQWLRGEGESLEIRIRGKLVRSDKRPINNASMKVVMTYNDLKKAAQAKIDGDSFEVWLPIGAMKCYYVTFSVAADDVRAETGIFRNQIRQLAIDGFDIQLKPARTVQVNVTLDGKPVSDANVSARVSWGGTVSATSNAEGVASFEVPENKKLVDLLAWRENGEERLLGGFNFYGKNRLDARSARHNVELLPCESRKVVVLDENEKSVPDLPLTFSFSLPNRTYIGAPDSIAARTDARGEYTLHWLPKVNGASLNHYVQDQHWLHNFKAKKDMESPVLELRVINRPLRRITGKVSLEEKSDLSLGGFAVEFSGNDVAEWNGHSVYAYTDAEGKFAVDLIPDNTYSYWIEDETWISADVHGVPADSEWDDIDPVELKLSRGHPIKVSVISETTNAPIAGVDVSLNSQRGYPLIKNGQTTFIRSGSRLRRVTDQSGVIEAVVPAEKIEVSAFVEDWRVKKKLEISSDKPNEITFRKQTAPVQITGKLKTWGETRVDFRTLQIKAEGLDRTSNEKLTLTADETGAFSFEAVAKAIGVTVYSGDHKLAGTALIRVPQETVEIELCPTQDYTGQILDASEQPVADHNVWAWIKVNGGGNNGLRSGTTLRTKVSSKTDANGHFTLESLPCNTEILVGTDQYDKALNRFETVETLVLRPEAAPRQRKVKRLLARNEPPPSEIAKIYEQVRRDCQLAGYHLLVTVSDTTNFELQRQLKKTLDVALRDLAQESGKPHYPSGWMQMAVDSPELNRSINRKLAKFKKWDTPEDSALICIYDASGKQLARKTFTSSAPDFADSIKTLMANNGPKKNDAVDKWETAFATANENDQRVLVMVGDLNQKPAQRLRRWMDEHEETLEKDFVLLTIDNSFDLRVDEATVALEDLNVTLPAVVVLDVDQQVVAHCGKLDPTQFGRVQMGLQQVLEKGCQKIEDDEIKRIVSQPAALGGG